MVYLRRVVFVPHIKIHAAICDIQIAAVSVDKLVTLRAICSNAIEGKIIPIIRVIDPSFKHIYVTWTIVTKPSFLGAVKSCLVKLPAISLASIIYPPVSVTAHEASCGNITTDEAQVFSCFAGGCSFFNATSRKRKHNNSAYQ